MPGWRLGLVVENWANVWRSEPATHLHLGKYHCINIAQARIDSIMQSAAVKERKRVEREAQHLAASTTKATKVAENVPHNRRKY
ncbi:hypothetical protein A0H81_08841 [Grifola frondosa]|uniref:Uncharacterized protein n=1 Tax=Grifola frondosa TaxID=5627 RepID=A0A1C7M410_GRIFR|nr:hypothetical protein A0H81_08841 [Grifola frondosa]